MMMITKELMMTDREIDDDHEGINGGWSVNDDDCEGLNDG